MDTLKRLRELLDGKGENYIMPFFWMHGEGKRVLGEELEKVRECGIRAICVESRPHPDFLGEAWWSEMDFLMEEARRHDLRVWLLDDAKFPTGTANGAYRRRPELAKTYLAERHMDIQGPVRENAVVIEPFLGKTGRLLAVLAFPKPDTESLDVVAEGCIDLTSNVHDGMVYFDLPEGYYRLFVLFTTQTGGGREFYMNLIDEASVRYFIDTVYEPHYKRYKEYFGNTFAGFFSDEPELGNTPGYDFQDKLGKRDVRLPWSHELEAAIKSRWGNDYAHRLPALWYEIGETTAAIRFDYMDMITRLVDKCFAGQTGRWCRDHGVEYIGHIIEDDNAHGRLGCSIGHYFRAQRGQDMSGVDVVLLQIMPGFTGACHQWIASDRDGEFFHFGLAKLGSSLAHLDPAKKGRAMCELFGAYGWAEGIGLMKWLTDHMLVRGINRFVPHAFSPFFPDKDCPPHFYARGNNPQFRFFADLMKYMNRLSHLLNGGRQVADAAVLYHGEAEWTGREAMLFQKPVRALMESQIECHVVPDDIWTEEGTQVRDGFLWIGENRYSVLVLPHCKIIPRQTAHFAAGAAKQGLPVYMVGALPEAVIGGEALPEDFEDYVRVTALDELALCVREAVETVFGVSMPLPFLRGCKYRHDDGHIYMFFNESPTKSVCASIRLNGEESRVLLKYDGLKNGIEPVSLENKELSLSLKPGEAAVYVTSGLDSAPLIRYIPIRTQTVETDWKLSMAEPLEYPEFRYEKTLPAGCRLPNMNGPEQYPRFTGTFRYEGCAEIEYARGDRLVLELPAAGDCAEVYVNGKLADRLLSGPFNTDITNYVQNGKNGLTIDVTNTLVWRMHDGQSAHMQVGPTGLTEKPVIRYLKRL